MGRAKTAVKFTKLQEAFVGEYLVDKNATQAAIRAGYSRATAGAIGHNLLKKTEIRDRIEEGLKSLAEKTETTAEWVRKRLREEATDVSEFSSHSARIRALELIAKIEGMFEKDNSQKTTPMTELLATLQGKVMRPEAAAALWDDTKEDD